MLCDSSSLLSKLAKHICRRPEQVTHPLADSVFHLSVPVPVVGENRLRCVERCAERPPCRQQRPLTYTRMHFTAFASSVCEP
jgi:hypothetical protein